MSFLKCFKTLLLGSLLLACNQRDNNLVGSWQFERMNTGPLLTSADTLTHQLAERVYLGSVLRFDADGTFEMSNRDTTSEFQGTGIYAISTKDSLLMMERTTKSGNREKVTMKLRAITSDSLKLGNEIDMMVFSRMKE